MRQSPRLCCKGLTPRTVQASGKQPPPRARAIAVALVLGALLALALPATAFAAGGERSLAPTQLALFGPSDPCEAQHDALKDSDDYFDKEIIQAVAADTVGAIISGVFTGDWRGAIIRGSVNAAGSLLSYYNERQKQAAGNQVALAQSIGGDARNYGVAMDKATAAFEALKQCRMNQAAAIKADYASGRISRGEAQERLAKVRERFNDELQTADHLGAQMNRRQEEMQAASDQLLASDPQARTLVTEMDQGPPPTGPYSGQPPSGQPPSGPPPSGPPPSGSPPSAETTVAVARNGVLHEGPASYTKSIVTLRRGDTVIVAGPTQGDWVPVRLVDGRTGFVNSQTFKPGAVHAAPPPPSPPPPPPQETRQEMAKADLAKAPPASKATVETVEATRFNLKRRESYGDRSRPRTTTLRSPST